MLAIITSAQFHNTTQLTIGHLWWIETISLFPHKLFFNNLYIILISCHTREHSFIQNMPRKKKTSLQQPSDNKENVENATATEKKGLPSHNRQHIVKTKARLKKNLRNAMQWIWISWQQTGERKIDHLRVQKQQCEFRVMLLKMILLGLHMSDQMKKMHLISLSEAWF